MINIRFRIKFFFTAIIFSAIWFFPATVPAKELRLAESNFSNVIDGILAHSCLRKQNFGVKIHSLEQDETLYSVQSDRLFSPASNMKLLTTAMALKRMGPDYRFKTRLYGAMPIIKETLNGDLEELINGLISAERLEAMSSYEKDNEK